MLIPETMSVVVDLALLLAAAIFFMSGYKAEQVRMASSIDLQLFFVSVFWMMKLPTVNPYLMQANPCRPPSGSASSTSWGVS